MSRTTKRIIFATFLAIVALVVTAALGVWQYARAYRADIEKRILTSQTMDLDNVSKFGKYVPEKYYGQKIRTSGNLVCEDNFRNVIPAAGIDWQVSAVRLPDNSLLAVAGVEDFCDSQPGKSNWIGRIQPAQDFTQLPAIYEPSAITAAINTDDLVHRWKANVRDGYLLVMRDVPTKLLVLPPVGIDIRNLFYAWQWWIFAAFAVFIYVRFVRDELLEKHKQ